MSALTLYALPHSGYCAKVRIVLRAKGLTWREEPPPGGYRSEAYRALVPGGNLPALRHDGLLLADSEVIAEYLEEVFPDPALLPLGPADRARMRSRGRFHDTRLEPALRALYPSVRPDQRDPALAARQSAELSQRLGQLERLIEDGGPLPFGLGDCALPATLAWIEALTPVLGLAIDWPEGIRTHAAVLESVPSVAVEMSAFRPAVADWLASVGARAL